MSLSPREAVCRGLLVVGTAAAAALAPALFLTNLESGMRRQRTVETNALYTHPLPDSVKPTEGSGKRISEISVRAVEQGVSHEHISPDLGKNPDEINRGQ